MGRDELGQQRLALDDAVAARDSSLADRNLKEGNVIEPDDPN